MRHCTHLVGRVTAVAIWTSRTTVHVVTGIPATIAAIDELGDFIAVPRTIFRDVNIVTTESDALRIAVTVGKDTLVKTGWWLVACSTFAITVNAQYFADQLGAVLWAGTVVVVTNGHVQEAVRTECQSATVVRARAAKGVVGFLGLVTHVVDDFSDVRNALHVGADFHAHQNVGIATKRTVVTFGGGAEVDVTIFFKLRVNRNT